MSDQNDPANPEQDTQAPSSSSRGARRTTLIVVVAVLVSTVLGGGAFAVYKVFFDGGPRPADVLPATTVAIVSIDLDPSAGQKIEALKTIRKFPQLKKELGLDPRDDLRKFIVEKGFGCEDIDFDTDVKPWIGERAAVAAVDLGGDEPVPALALQITDQKKADAGFEDLATCAEENLGYVTGVDYLIASDTAEHAQAILASGKQESLADDAKYQKWTDEAGDQGVVNFYVSSRASDYLIDGLEDLTSELGGLFGGASSFGDSGFSSDLDFESGVAGESAPPAAAECDSSADPFDALREQLKSFDGLAGTVRFADGGMELAVATGGLGQIASTATVGKQIGSLPADTAIALGLGIPRTYAEDLVDQLTCSAGLGEDLVAQLEEESGLDLPEDLADLLGTAITLSLGGDAPEDLSSIDGISDIPVGLAIHGAPEKITRAIARIEEHFGESLEDALGITISSSDSLVVLSPSTSYAETLLRRGGLGSSDDFREAVPEADRAGGVLFVDFAGPWRQALLDLASGEGLSDSEVDEADENLAPLQSLGVSSWVSDGASHLLLKLSTR